MENGKKIIGNPEDITSLKVLEIFDVYEVGPGESYYEVIVRPLIWVDSEVVKRGGL